MLMAGAERRVTDACRRKSRALSIVAAGGRRSHGPIELRRHLSTLLEDDDVALVTAAAAANKRASSVASARLWRRRQLAARAGVRGVLLLPPHN